MRMKMKREKNILITFARSIWSLDVARKLHAGGHKVHAADSIGWHITRFSNAVDSCHTVPSPRFDPEGYIKALVAIVKKEKIDYLIPIYEEIGLISKYKELFPESCTLFCPDHQLFHDLHNKWLFQCKLNELGIPTAKCQLISPKEQLTKLDFTTPFAYKACYSRASQQVKKVFPQQNLPPVQTVAHNPWLAQEWIEGKKFCSYSICNQGKIQASGTYPVAFAIDDNSCLLFEAIDHPPIVQWIENFVKKVNYTGQISFDFIESKEKNLFAIECNPRTTSGLHLFKDDDCIDRAFLGLNSEPIFPQAGRRQQILTGMLLYGWKTLRKKQQAKNFIKAVCSTKDIVFQSTDLKPFLSEPLVFAGILLNSWKNKLSIPDYFTHDHDWNGESH